MRRNKTAAFFTTTAISPTTSISPTTEDLCSDVACPLLPGPYTNTTTSVFPTGVSGKVTTKIEWFDAANNRLLCADVTAKI